MGTPRKFCGRHCLGFQELTRPGGHCGMCVRVCVCVCARVCVEGTNFWLVCLETIGNATPIPGWFFIRKPSKNGHNVLGPAPHPISTFTRWVRFHARMTPPMRPISTSPRRTSRRLRAMALSWARRALATRMFETRRLVIVVIDVKHHPLWICCNGFRFGEAIFKVTTHQILHSFLQKADAEDSRFGQALT